ncbi:MAG: hypothetical protein J1E56_06250 [Ruminococcus sp.]|nr:hypothetical protein [Ruminococcus sp.]
MIIDVTGIELIPGNKGSDCPGNGEHKDKSGNYIECCCDECDYMMCCLEDICKTCTDYRCKNT